MGFEKVIVPAHALRSVDTKKLGIKVVGVRSIKEAFKEI